MRIEMAVTWRWANAPTDSCPLQALRRATPEAFEPRLTYTDDTTTWTIEATEVLSTWSRWCALSVAHLWDCPEPVLRWLQTGDPQLREPALQRTDASTAASTAARAALLPPQLQLHQLCASSAAIALGWRRAQQAQAARLVLLSHAEHQRLQLPDDYRPLARGTGAQRAVLRDYALQRGLAELAEALAPPQA